MIQRNKLIFIGTSFMLAFTLVLILTFIYAYINSEKTVKITINEYGEANIEMFIVIPFVLVMSLITFYLSYKNFMEEDNEK